MLTTGITGENVLYISDDLRWADNFVFETLDSLKQRYVKLPADLAIRHSWQRFQDARHIVIHWEGRKRLGGAIVEEIIDVDPFFDTGARIVVVTTEPRREDVVYFGELGITKIIHLRNNKRFVPEARNLLHSFLKNDRPPAEESCEWHDLLRAIDAAGDNVRDDKLEEKLNRLNKGEDSARFFDALACLKIKNKQYEQAEDLLTKAIELNSHYFRAYKSLVRLYREQGQQEKAMALCRKMQAMNKNNISTLVDMGEIYYTSGLSERAEKYFRSALDKDGYCGRALNGLAQIHFDRDEISESRQLISKSSLAYKFAQKLNRQGVELVTQGHYKKALEHYSKAQYVIPLQDKGPMLFFNIGLCYFRWGRFDMAKEFLKIALIKEPNYEKAKKLYQLIDSRISTAVEHSV